MKKNIGYIVVCLMIGLGLVVSIVSAFPQASNGENGNSRCPFADQLTEEQQEALQQLIQELRDSGATREEIREAVMQFLEEQGIEIQTPQIGNSNP
jgi:predicted transcriptional regulator YheO